MLVVRVKLGKRIWSVEDVCLDEMGEINDQEQSCWL